LFKFAVDSHGLFGSNLLAAKVAGHELKGMAAYFSLGTPDVYMPLMALVDYRGFRLICMCVLPLGRSSLIYGSDDGGNTVLASDGMFNKRIRAAAKRLNLKPHVCGVNEGRTKRLWAAADVEGHRGTDGKLYMLDFSRSMPPVTPDRRMHNGHLYQLLRKEMVERYERPLCPDAYSGFVINDPAAREHNADVDAATKHLLEMRVPQFAKELMYSVLEADSHNALSKVRVTDEFHRMAINIRYIGFVYRALQSQGERAQRCLQLLLIESLARDLKNRLRIRLQRKMKQLRVPLEVPYRRLIVNFLNLAFSNRDDAFLEASAQRLLKYFSFDEATLKSLGNLVRSVSFAHPSQPAFSGRWLLFKRIRAMTGLRFTQACADKFKGIGQWNSAEPIDILDLVEIGERVKHMNIVDSAEGTFFSHKGFEFGHKHALAIDMFQRAVKKYELALGSSPHDFNVLFSCAVAMYKLLEQRAKQSVLLERGRATMSSETGRWSDDNVYFNAKDSLVVQADQFFLMANDAKPNDKRLLCSYAQFLVRSQRFERAEDFFLRALTVDPNYSYALMEYGNFLCARGKTEAGNAVLHRAAAVHSRVETQSAITGRVAGGVLRVYLADGTYKTVAVKANTPVADVKAAFINAIVQRLRKTRTYAANQVDAIAALYEEYEIHEFVPLNTPSSSDDGGGDDGDDGGGDGDGGANDDGGGGGDNDDSGSSPSSSSSSGGGDHHHGADSSSAGDAADSHLALASCVSCPSISSELALKSIFASKIMEKSINPWVLLQRPGNQSQLLFKPVTSSMDAVNARAWAIWGFWNVQKLVNLLGSLQGSVPFEAVRQAEVERVLAEVTMTWRHSIDRLILGQCRWSKSCRVPKKTSSLEWLSVATMYMYRIVMSLFGVVAAACDCDKMSASPTLAYTYSDTINSKNTGIASSAADFVDFCRSFFEQRLRNSYSRAFIHKEKVERKKLQGQLRDSFVRFIQVLNHIHHQHWAYLKPLDLHSSFIFVYLYAHQFAIDNLDLNKSLSQQVFSPMARDLEQWLKPFAGKK
jgi:tetratricopeptide (TPR) repeat protein